MGVRLPFWQSSFTKKDNWKDFVVIVVIFVYVLLLLTSTLGKKQMRTGVGQSGSKGLPHVWLASSCLAY